MRAGAGATQPAVAGERSGRCRALQGHAVWRLCWRCVRGHPGQHPVPSRALGDAVDPRQPLHRPVCDELCGYGMGVRGCPIAFAQSLNHSVVVCMSFCDWQQSLTCPRRGPLTCPCM